MTFPSQLTWTDLGDTYDGPHATPQRVTSGPYFLNISSLSEGRLDLAKSDHVSAEEFTKWTRRVTPQADDLLFSYETRLGEAALMPDNVKACLGRRMALLRPNRDIVHPRFLLYYYLSPAFQQLIEQNTIYGATVNRISLSTIGKWPVTIPSLKDQRSIAEVLGSLDDKIAANTKIAETSSLLAQSLFAAASGTGGIEVALADSCSLLSRGITPKYSSDEETMVVLNQKCVRGQRVDLAPSRRTLLTKVRQEKILLEDDVLVNSTGQGTLGRVARWTHDANVTVDSHITIVRFNPNVVDPVCGGFAMLHNEENIAAMAEGSTGQTELSRVELGKLTLRLPSLEQQQLLGRQLATMTSMENAHLRESQTLAKTRDALLPQLMSGKLRVKDAEAIVAAAV